SEETVDRVRQSFVRSPEKSVRKASRELALPKSTVWDVLNKRLKFKAYKLTLVQALTENDKQLRTVFSVNMLECMENDDFGDRIVFIEHVRDSPKLNVFAAICKRKLYGPFIFAEQSNWLIPQLEEDSQDFIFQQDGAPPHFHNDVRMYLNEQLPQRWIGRTGRDDEALLKWPPMSPDMTPCDFFLWGCIKDKVFVPPLPRDLVELRGRIRDAFAAITRDMLARVWVEMEYRLDICRVTKGAHIESL
ncbi:hypothetical protein C0J52_26690, partial [Blattella germanica]